MDYKRRKEAQAVDIYSYMSALSQLKQAGYCRYRLNGNNSVEINLHNNTWYWTDWATGERGVSAFQYLVRVEGMSEERAADMVLGYSFEPAPKPEAMPQKKKEFWLPKPSPSYDEIRSYLKSRGIDEEIINFCIKKNLLYESGKYHSAVFVGYNEDGRAAYASYRATDGSGIKKECAGSQKKYSFRIVGDAESDTVHCFESAIDALSFATIAKMKGGSWESLNLLSLGGVSVTKSALPDGTVRAEQASLQSYLGAHGSAQKIVLHLDNDEAGRTGTKNIIAAYGNDYSVADAPPKTGKDVNDELMFRISLAQVRGTAHRKNER